MTPVFETEFLRLIRSRKFKLLFLVTIFPAVIYLLSPNASGTGVEPLKKGFEDLFADLLPNYWLGIIGQLIAVIIMSDLIAGEIDRGTIRLILARPIGIGEFLAGKFLAGLSALLVLFGIPYAVVWLYAPLPYRAGLAGVKALAVDFGAVLASTAVILAFLGALSMFLAVLVRRPLYATLATFGILFLGQFLLPQVPYFEHPERLTLGYQALVMLKAGFESLSVTGTPWKTAVAFAVASASLLLVTWLLLVKGEFPD
ncbi:ABC transporter permease [Thermococcus nautili]|uniref:ABC-type transport system involved in multi-copper enzyme maturation, permease component n=1 Tax=Thermococcus nautili TaxID=195522 RepID=W8P5F1_9EURY|nr:ABC transporter permease [Thermococcus nautili]AHL22690.1 ABC-type transport system involved in multi-copper enzyme maturation, permease component [Thermococcus nautili]